MIIIIMKNIIIRKLWMLLLPLIIMAACSPQEMDDFSLSEMGIVADANISFTQTVSPNSDNVITFTSTTVLPDNGVYTMRWDLGNGGTSNKVTATGQYPFAGDYTVTLSIYNPDGSVAKKSVVLSFPKSDFNLVNTPLYVNLTGGAGDVDGKTWVLDRYNNFAKEVKNATGLNINGHMGLGPLNSRGQEWWGAAANDKSMWTIYDFKFTFIQNGVKLNIENKGEGYGRKAVAAANGFNVTSIAGDDALFTYSGGQYTFSLTEGGQYPILTLSGNAFLGYYCGHQDYEIVYQTEKVMALVVHNLVEGQDWCFVYCREDLNVPPPPVVKLNKSIPLMETFEGATTLAFVAEDMGGPKKSAIIGNPVPLPINESSKVYRYWKSTGFYSNLSFTATDYKFDLTTVNKVKVKVFIPSFNDYTTEYAVAGDWISNKKLKPQLAVKLQNSEKGGDAWQTQTEIVKADLQMDKWIELEFDFNGVKDRKDYDKIVIQFGAEGHAGPGFFYFDDFSFNN